VGVGDPDSRYWNTSDYYWTSNGLGCSGSTGNISATFSVAT